MRRVAAALALLLAGCSEQAPAEPPAPPPPCPVVAPAAPAPKPIWPDRCAEDWYVKADIPACAKDWIVELSAQQKAIAKKRNRK